MALPGDEEQDLDGGERVCQCMEVTEKTIEHAIRVLQLKTVDEVRRATKASGGCGSCAPDIEEILDRCARGEYRHELTEDDKRRVMRTLRRTTIWAKDKGLKPLDLPPASSVI